MFSNLGINTDGKVDHPIVMTEPVANPNYCRQRMFHLDFNLFIVLLILVWTSLKMINNSNFICCNTFYMNATDSKCHQAQGVGWLGHYKQCRGTDFVKLPLVICFGLWLVRCKSELNSSQSKERNLWHLPGHHSSHKITVHHLEGDAVLKEKTRHRSITYYIFAEMSELLFECYGIPKVTYGVDSLFSLYKNHPQPGKCI